MPKPTWFEDLPRDRCIAEVSMWSADLGRLGDEAERIEPYADVLHIDVADGVFAPAFLFFPDLVAAIRKRTDLPLHVHLMAEDRILLPQVQQFLESGADLISVHVENQNATEAVDMITDAGVHAGIVLQLETPVQQAAPLLEKTRMLTLLGTALGVKGQDLSPLANGRLVEARKMVAEHGSNRHIVAADGAIREHTVLGLLRSGAQTVVMGSLFFGASDLAAVTDWLAQQPLA